MHHCRVLKQHESERFWRKVDKTDSCWNWTGAKFLTGYGMVRLDGKNFGAHRLSYVMKHGSIPSGLIICHKCDNPSCVNPDHLFAGTYKDNAQDMIAKGRKSDSAGEANGQAILTAIQAEEIRNRYAKGDMPQCELARKYNVSPALIGLITKGRIWVTASGPLTDGMAIRDLRPSKVRGEANHNAKLTEEKVIALRRRYANGGITMKKLGKLFGICAQTACSIIHGKKWKHVKEVCA